MLEEEKYFQTLMFAALRCLSADIFFNERYKTNLILYFYWGYIQDYIVIN